ncbi:MAG: 2'-5' RNA ligase family protein [Salinarimonas sp.]
MRQEDAVPDAAPPLIVTLALDEDSHAFFQAQRRAYFPPARDIVPAHLTLFHKLPGDLEASVAATLAEAAAARAPLAMSCSGVRFLGRGVAYAIESGALVALRRALAARFAPWLGPQDRQGGPAHVTIQNKVAPHVAKALAARLESGFVPFPVVGEGLLLWRYRGGPWEAAGRFPFAGAG